MEDIKVSLIASSVRPQFYKTFLDTLAGTSVEYEVIFVGNKYPDNIFGPQDPNIHAIEYTRPIEVNENGPMMFRYILAQNIKPAQCYEIARRYAKGETVIWTADDCEHTPDVVGKAYRFWKSLNDEKAILSIQTLENGMLCNMLDHSFFGWHRNSPLMAPLGLMSRDYLDKIGGFDRRYCCGQYENDVVMRTIADGGRVEIFGDRQNCIVIDHYRKHGIVRPFAKGYNHDRSILEGSWVKDGKTSLVRNDAFEPYEGTAPDLLGKSQSFNLTNMWV